MIPVSSDFLTVCAGVNVALLPSFVTVTLPLLSTVIVASAKSGLAAITAALIFSCSGPVTFSGSATSTGVGALTPSLLSSCFTVFSAGIVPKTFPFLSFTVTAPSSPTSIFASAGRVGLACLIASSTAFLFSGVNAFALSTVIGVSGALITYFALSLPASFDSLSFASFAFALTSVPGLTLSFGSVITPVVSSIVKPSTAGSIFHLSPSFVAVTVLSFPAGSL